MTTRNVVMCTCVGAASKLLRGTVFDMVIIDEAAQALEAACWVPMLHSSKVCLRCIVTDCPARCAWESDVNCQGVCECAVRMPLSVLM